MREDLDKNGLLHFWNKIKTRIPALAPVQSVNGKTGSVDTREFDFAFTGSSSITSQVDTAISENGVGSYSFSITGGANNDMPSTTGAYYGFIQCTSTNYIQITCYGNTGSVNGVRIWRRIKTNGSWDGWRPIPSTGFIPANSSFNDYIEPGMYRFQTGMTPATGITYGQLLVIRGTSDTCAQMVFPYTDGASWSAKMRWGRDVTGDSPTWGDWRTIRDSVNTPITRVNSTTLTTSTIASGVYTNIGTITVPAGKAVVTAKVRFSSNATGYRRIIASTNSAATATSAPTIWGICLEESKSAVNGAFTTCGCSDVIVTSSAQTVYLWAYQNSGSDLTLSSFGFRALLLTTDAS